VVLKVIESYDWSLWVMKMALSSIDMFEEVGWSAEKILNKTEDSIAPWELHVESEKLLRFRFLLV